MNKSSAAENPATRMVIGQKLTRVAEYSATHFHVILHS